MKTKFKTKKNNLNRNVFLPAAVLAVILAGFIIVIVKDAKAAVVCQYCDTQRPTTLDATEITGNSATLNGSVAEWQRSGPTQNVYVGFFYRPSPQSNYNFTGWAATVPEGAGPYSFSLTVNSLIPNTTYYFRAYVYVDDSSSGPHDQEGLERTFQTPPPLSYSLSCTNSCNFAGIAGGANPVDQTLTITNTDTRSVNWTAATNGPRVTVSPASGSTAAGASSSATVSFDTSGTPPGSYNNIGIITITAEGISKTMPVNLSIGEPLTITQSVWNIFKKSDLETPITGFPKTFAGKADLIVSGSSVGEGSFQANLLIINSADRAAATVQDFFVIPAQPPPAPLPGPPPNPINSVCEQLTVSWIDVAGETGYRVYRNTTGGTNLANYARVGGDRPADSTSYTETTPPLSAGTAYYYIVTSFNTFGESVVGAGWPVGPTIVNPCIPDLSASRKILYQVNGVAYSGQTIRNGDQLTFRIIIENAGTATAYDLYIVDTVTDNLDYVAGTARLNGNTIAEKVQGNDITWPWPDPSSNPNSNLGDKPVGGTNWTLSFDAIVNSDSSLTVDYIENKGRIYYDLSEGNNNDNLSVPFGTGLIPVRTGQALVPNIREIAP